MRLQYSLASSPTWFQFPVKPARINVYKRSAHEPPCDSPFVGLLAVHMARTAAGLHLDNALHIVGAITYFIEAFCFEYELRVGETMNRSKVTFVSVCSLFLGALVLSRPILACHVCITSSNEHSSSEQDAIENAGWL